MQVKPLSKKVYNKAIELGVEEIELSFSGGSDEGFLNVGLSPKYNEAFADEIESWAWEVYDYSGAGEGYEYGDNIIYDLKNKTVSTNEWSMVRQESEYDISSLETEASPGSTRLVADDR
jgi:hypothetical protein